MTIYNLCHRGVAMLGGVTLLAAQIFFNLEVLGDVPTFSGLYVASIALPISMAIAVSVMEYYSSERKYVRAFFVFVVLLVGLSHTLVVALERGTHARDNTSAKSNHVIELAIEEHQAAKAALTDLKGRMDEESRNCPRRKRPPCRGKTWRKLNADLPAAQERVAGALDKRSKLGPKDEGDSMAKRYGKLAHIIDLVHPATLPFAMEAGALLLIGFAFRGGHANPGPAAQSSPRVTKLEEAKIAVARIKHDKGELPPIDMIVAETGLPRTTVWRATKAL